MRPADPGTADRPGCPVRHDGTVALHGPQFTEDPAGLYRRMRAEHGPVVPIELEGGVPAWFVGDYREINEVCGDPRVFARAPHRWRHWDRVPEGWSLLPYVAAQPSMGFTEGDEYRTRVEIFADVLGGYDQFELQAHCEQHADRLIDGFATGGEAELIAQYADALPLYVLAQVCGVAPEQTEGLVHDMTGSIGGGDSTAALDRIVRRMHSMVAAKRENPGPDLTSRMLRHQDRVTDEQIAYDMLITMTAGHLTVAHWIGNTMRLMLTDERFAIGLAGGRRSVGQALNEVLWEETPTQNYIGRYATQDVQLGGRLIRAGDMLVLGLAAGNTDPRIRPGSYADSVGNNAFLSFGIGDRGCPHPAPEVAETIARAGIEVLLDRLPDIRLAVPPGELRWIPSVWMRGLTALPVRFSPSYVVGA
ncbi:cytochrome P450 [Saccharopolyspora gregorii]|uniref:Cytochrome P450 n=1 Tax=Saccharopolyspora gregorii TaxID=33914 RepID=A0ABP6RVZ5_9PSEU|nr:cytochrome P450 [Saccharopolyspora gregorii]